MTLRVAIVGPGRAGRSLANAFSAAGIDVLGLIGRDASRELLADADVVLITVRDGDLRAALAKLPPLRSGAVVLSASGATSLSVGGWRPTGTFHPLVSLADPDAGARMLHGAWIGVDGDPDAVAAAKTLAAAIGAHVLKIPPGAKPGYHAAAVIAANFPVVLAAAAEREMRRVGIEPEAAHGAVAQLMRSALEGIEALGPEKALTGPVSRGDVGTVLRNLQALADDPATRDLYVAATRIAIELARAAGTNPDRLAEIERVLLHFLHP